MIGELVDRPPSEDEKLYAALGSGVGAALVVGYVAYVMSSGDEAPPSLLAGGEGLGLEDAGPAMSRLEADPY